MKEKKEGLRSVVTASGLEIAGLTIRLRLVCSFAMAADEGGTTNET